MCSIPDPQFKGKKVTIVGLAREGVALTRYLAAQGAEVTVSDNKTADQLSHALSQIADLPVRLSLGGNLAEDVVSADVVYVSPGVPRGLPFLVAAAEHGVPLSSETELFLTLCPAPVVGITGSSGKTTTTTLIGEFLKESGYAVFVGGNIGTPLIGRLGEITSDGWVVLELSSFQLQHLKQSPRMALITNITPNHLDRHASMEEYVAAKENIVTYQRPDDGAVLNLEDPITVDIGRRCRSQVFHFSQRQEVDQGTYVRDGEIIYRHGGREEVIAALSEIRLRGNHNIDNVLAAVAAVAWCGVTSVAIRHVLARFTGVEHRLELVRELDGVVYYNDSIATAPERTVAALRSFDRPIVLIAGGRDKHLPLERFAAEALARCRAVVLVGEAAPLLRDALAIQQIKQESATRVVSVDDFATAVSAARHLAQPGDVVLLSPACTSFDLFRDFEERGREFKRIVMDLV